MQAPTQTVSFNRSELRDGQWKLIQAMEADFPKVTLSAITWRTCDTENSWYYPAFKVILLCDDMSKHYDAALFFAAHEFGHAITWQTQGTIDEESADEIATVEMIKLGYADQLVGASVYWSDQKPLKGAPGDGHPSNYFRQWFLTCMVSGFEGLDGADHCVGLYNSTKKKWEIRFE
jgi:hypothetical protein